MFKRQKMSGRKTELIQITESLSETAIYCVGDELLFHKGHGIESNN